MDFSAQPVVAVIDDDRTVDESAALLLQSDGFGVDVFGSAERFLAVRETDPGRVDRYGCLLVDWILPGMSGLDLCQRLARGPHVSMILMSSVTLGPQARQDMRAADIEFLAKPFDPDLLLTELAERLLFH